MSTLIAIGKFFLEFTKTLIIDTVIQAILTPYNEIKRKENERNMRGNFVCL